MQQLRNLSFNYVHRFQLAEVAVYVLKARRQITGAREQQDWNFWLYLAHELGKLRSGHAIEKVVEDHQSHRLAFQNPQSNLCFCHRADGMPMSL